MKFTLVSILYLLQTSQSDLRDYTYVNIIFLQRQYATNHGFQLEQGMHYTKAPTMHLCYYMYVVCD